MATQYRRRVGMVDDQRMSTNTGSGGEWRSMNTGDGDARKSMNMSSSDTWNGSGGA
jgi:hypothetical protein